MKNVRKEIRDNLLDSYYAINRGSINKGVNYLTRARLYNALWAVVGDESCWMLGGSICAEIEDQR